MLAHSALYVVAFYISGTGTRHEDQIIRRGLIRSYMIESRSDQSAAAVAVDCLTDLFGGGYSYSKVIIFCFERIGNERGGYERFTAAVNTLKIPVTGNRSYRH